MLTRYSYVLVALGLSVSALAQTKYTGTLKCGKPDVNHMVQIGDKPGHMYVVVQMKCTSDNIELEGLKIKEDLGTESSEVNGASSQDHGWDVITMSNGDKVYLRNQGTSKMKGEVLDTGEGKTSFAGGTGKFKGLKGTGTFKLKGSADGSVEVEVEGDYTIAAPAPKKK